MFLHMNLPGKTHWDAYLKGCTNQNPKDIIMLKSAKTFLMHQLKGMSRMQQAQEMQHLGKYISRNAERNFRRRLCK